MSRLFSAQALTALVAFAPAIAGADVFINEIHYDNASTDVGEAVEVVATAGEDLTLYSLHFYNGNGGALSTSTSPNIQTVGNVAARTCGTAVSIGYVTPNQIENGAPDGVALVGPGSTLVQFLSWEGSFSGTAGIANGVGSSDIGVSEEPAPAAGNSLQLGGNATSYAGFTWNAPATATLGQCNNGQTFGTPVDNPPTVAGSDPAHNQVDVPFDTSLSLTFSEPVDTLGTWFSLNCGAGTPSLTSSAGPATTFTLTPSAPIGYSKLCTLTVIASQIQDRDGTPNLMDFDAQIQFETEADNAPEVVATVPANLDTDVSRGANLSVTFSEPVNAPAAAFLILCPDTETSSLPFTLSSDDDTTFELDPSTDLPAATDCRLEVLAAQVTDLDGVPHNPDLDARSSFSTAALAPPAVVSTVPAKNATNFPSAGDLQVLFDTTVTLSPGAFTLSCAQSTGIVLTPNAGSGTSFTISTGTALIAGDSCTFTIVAANVLSGDGLNPDADEVVNFTVASSGSGNYYQNVNLASAEQLRCTLHQTIRGHNVGSYTLAWEVLELGEEDPNSPGRVLDAYRNCSYLAGASGDRVGGSGGGATCKGPNGGSTADDDPGERYNREHTWPNSIGFPSNSLAAYTDTHMLYATDEGYNGTRGSKPLGYCMGCAGEEPTDPNNGVGGGSGVYPGNSNWYDGSTYEVWNHRKGDIARAVMYMAIRYEGGDSVPDLELTDTRALIVGTPSSASNAYMGLKTDLLQWHQFDPVDARELDRNDIVQSYQNNRNPFIDHPEWATAALFNSSQPTQCVLNVNAPAANDDSYATPLDTEINTAVTAANDGVLANDSDVEGAPLSAQLVSGVATGTLALVANGDFTYTPPNGFCGTTSFSYRASDGVRLSTPRTATISVGTSCSGNNPPTANDDAITVAEDSGTTVVNVLTNDTSAPDVGETLTVTGVTQGTRGVVSLVGGVVSYTPNANANGSDAFTYTISDGNGGSDNATVNVTINPLNDAPAANDDTLTVDEDSGATVVDVLGNDSIAPDVGETLTVTAVTQGTRGSVTQNAGVVSYTPNANANGSDAFTYTISDGNGGSDSATVNVTINPLNDAPAANDDTLTVDEDSGATIVDVLSNDSSAPDTGETLTVTAVTPGTRGVVTLNANVVSYTPNLNANGNDTFTYTISDGNGGSDSATVNVTINPIADAPSIVLASGSILAENSAAGSAAGQVDAVDPDAGSSLTFSIVAGNTGNAFAIDASGAITVNNSIALDFESTPSFSLTVQVSDGGLSDTDQVTINLSDVNEAPSLVGASLAVAEDSAAGTLVGSPLMGSDPDTSAPNNTLSYAITAGNTGNAFAIDANGQISVLTAAAIADPGSFVLTVRLSDGGGLSADATVNITVGGSNDAPVLQNASFSLAENSGSNTVVGVLNGSDPDAGDVLSYAIVGGNSGNAFAISGDQIIVANAAALDFETTPQFVLTVQVSDGALTDTAQVTIDLNNVNEAPAVVDASFSLAENSAAATVVGTVTASDPDAGTSLNYAITAGNTSGAFAMNGAQIVVVSSLPLDYEQTRQFLLTINASDGQSSDSGTIRIVLDNVDETAINDDHFTHVVEDSLAASLDVFANDVSDDLLPFIISSAGPAAHGTVTFDVSFLTYAPAANYCGPDTFEYVNLGHVATVTLEVQCVNDAPTVASSLISVSSQEGLAITPFSIASGFADVDGDDLDYSQTGLPAGLSLDAETGEISGTPAAGSATSGVAVTITATDSGGLSAQQSFQYEVLEPLGDAIFGDGFEGND